MAKIYTFSLKGKEQNHNVVGGDSITEEEGFIIVKDAQGKVVAKFSWAEVQGYSESGGKA